MKRESDESLRNVLKEVVKSDHLKKGFYQSRIKKIWLEDIGKMVAHQTDSIYIDKSTVFIVISSAPLRHQLSMGASKLVDLFNDRLGDNIVSKVILR